MDDQQDDPASDNPFRAWRRITGNPDISPEVAEVLGRWKGDERITPALALDVASFVARAVRDGASGRGRPVEKPAGYLVANMRKQLERATAAPVKLPMFVPDGPRPTEEEYLEECRVKAEWRRKQSKTKEQQRRERRAAILRPEAI